MVDTPLMPHLFKEELYHFSTPMVVVLPREWIAYSAEDQSLLKKILASVKVDINAVLILERPSLELADLKVFGPGRVLVFGSQLPADIPMYQQATAQGFTVIRADDLRSLDEQKKKYLWTALRQMFSV